MDDDGAIFDKVAQELELDGYSLLPISALRCHHHHHHHGDGDPTTKSMFVPALVAQAFDTARCAMDALTLSSETNIGSILNKDDNILIDPKSDSGGWTGYHTATSKHGRYNQHREGFVFSNGEMFDVVTSTDQQQQQQQQQQHHQQQSNKNTFRKDMSQLFNIMHNIIAMGVLHAMERRLGLPQMYIQHELGPTNNCSQWHMKRYVVDDDNDKDHHSNSHFINANKIDHKIILPPHTDPSLISVVIIDHAGTNDGGMGLEVFHIRSSNNNSCGEWKEISYHGHDIAVIFVGSVFSYLKKGQKPNNVFPAAMHRVVRRCPENCCSESSSTNLRNCSVKSRMAATLFVRPSGDAVMKPLPPNSVYLDGNKYYPSFRVWNARVAKNYMKKKV